MNTDMAKRVSGGSSRQRSVSRSVQGEPKSSFKKQNENRSGWVERRVSHVYLDFQEGVETSNEQRTLKVCQRRAVQIVAEKSTRVGTKKRG